MSNSKKLYKQLNTLSTEKRNKKSMKIDISSVKDILSTINNEDKKVAIAVGKELFHIEEAVKLVVESFKNNGRLIYVGAGTSGRLGILDATECLPTFGADPRAVQGIIAGGKSAVFRSQEGAEDDIKAAIRDLKKVHPTSNDVICGIAASMRTPYVVAAMAEAKKLHTKTILITTNPRRLLSRPEMRNLKNNLDISICVDVGPEVLAGSTRMKSGTAQKMVLNMITTTAMIRLGKVYENMMVDLKMNSKKLEERAKRVIMTVTKVDYETAARYLAKASGHVKTAIVMIKRSVTAKQAQNLLKKANGFVRIATEE
ncbi:MAG: N-acetylmuramic acid 6-phosphate etherase [Ignavibacteriales bacterium]|nr:N-acetylmuramic acid 6-phosphate etherase [Ignavibacteriales bacterium]